MTAILLPNGKQQFIDINGKPLVGGTVGMFVVGTLVPKNTWQDAAQTVLNTDPIILDSRGQAVIYGSGAYRQIVKDALGNTIWDEIVDGAVTPPSGISGFSTTANLLVAYGGAITLPDGFVANTSGRDAEGDGGGGPFYYDASDTTTADNGGTIRVDGAGRRWKLIPDGSFLAEVFGAKGDGATNDAAAINAALAVAATSNAFVRGVDRKVYKINSSLTIDSGLTAYIGCGATLDFSGMTTGSAIIFAQTVSDANVRTAQNSIRAFEGVYMIGPGVAVTAVVAFNLTDTAPQISGLRIRQVSCQDFAKDVIFGDGAFMNTFEHCVFTILSGSPSTYSIAVPSGTGSGEKNTFVDCLWYNRPMIGTFSNGNADTYFDNCSLDYFGGDGFDITAGSVFVRGTHIENNDDTGTWFNLSSNANAALNITDSQIAITAAKANFSPFSVDDAVTNGGLYLSGIYIADANAMTVPLVIGTGKVIITPFAFYASGGDFTVGDAVNRLAYGTFENANYAGDWTFTGSTPPARTNTKARTGTYSLLFTGASGSTPQAMRNIPCEPGQRFVAEFWYQTSALSGTSGTFFSQASFCDVAGNSLVGSNALSVMTNIGTWTKVTIGMALPAPKGTDHVTFAINIFGTGSGTPLAYIDDVIVNLN